jgi:hypothetical protein
MNLLSHFDEMRSSKPTTLTGRVKKVAGQAAFYVVGAGAAILVLGIVLIMRVVGRDS